MDGLPPEGSEIRISAIKLRAVEQDRVIPMLADGDCSMGMVDIQMSNTHAFEFACQLLNRVRLNRDTHLNVSIVGTLEEIKLHTIEPQNQEGTSD